MYGVVKERKGTHKLPKPSFVSNEIWKDTLVSLNRMMPITHSRTSGVFGKCAMSTGWEVKGGRRGGGWLVMSVL